jgi:hypothetical protein
VVVIGRSKYNNTKSPLRTFAVVLLNNEKKLSLEETVVSAEIFPGLKPCAF